MKFKALMLSAVLAVMVGISAAASAQDDKQNPQTPNTQTSSQTHPPSALSTVIE